jgi:pyruvate dehydrogenase E2 component (dihydrolipoamide acetyltransferase)
MARLLRMPGISADAEEVVFLEWCTAQGSRITAGDPIATVETEKANVDIEADQDGVLWRTLIEPGQSVFVGSPVAVLLGVDEEVGDEAAVFEELGLTSANGAARKSPSTSVDAPIRVEQPMSLSDTATDRIFASPLARKLARENGIAIETVAGTGPGQRIVRVDIERVIADGVPQAVPTPQKQVVDSASAHTDVPHTGMRRAIARSLVASKQEAPHFYLDATCHVDALLALRRDINASGTVKVSINDFILKAVAKALIDVPEMNAIWMDDCVRRFTSADISVAIGSDTGLVTPVLRAADQMTLTQISDQVRDYSQRAKEGRLKQHELEGGAFSVSNLGMYGVERFSAILNPPQAGILAVGAVASRPIVIDGSLAVGNTVMVTLSVDHRPVDGVMAAQWLERFKTLMENPALILI